MMEKNRFIKKYGVVIALVALAIAFGFFVPGYLENLTNISNMVVYILPAAFGLTLVMVIDEIDLSYMGMIGVYTYSMVYLLKTFQLTTSVSLLILLGMGGTVGAVLGSLVGYKKLNSFIMSVGIGFLGVGISEGIHGGTFSLEGGTFLSTITLGSIGPLPISACFSVILLVFFYYLFNKTLWGHYVDAVGQNIDAANTTGINVHFKKLTVFCIAGGLFAISSALFVGRYTCALPNTGMKHFMLPVLLAPFLGMTMFKPGRPNFLGTFVGCYFFALIASGVKLSGLQYYYGLVIKGVFLIVALILVSVVGERKIKQVKF